MQQSSTTWGSCSSELSSKGTRILWRLSRGRCSIICGRIGERMLWYMWTICRYMMRNPGYLHILIIRHADGFYSPCESTSSTSISRRPSSSSTCRMTVSTSSDGIFRTARSPLRDLRSTLFWLCNLPHRLKNTTRTLVHSTGSPITSLGHPRLWLHCRNCIIHRNGNGGR